VPFRADNSIETPATSSSGVQGLTWLGERALCWMQLAGGGWRTRCFTWCSKRRVAELAGAGPCHPCAVAHTQCQEGQRERLSRAPMPTFMLPSCGKWKDPSDFPGLRAELSVGKSKPQDQFITCMPHLSSPRLSGTGQATAWRCHHFISKTQGRDSNTCRSVKR